MTISTRLRENMKDSKAVHAAAGAGDLALEKLRELPETVTRLRSQAGKYQDDLREQAAKYRGELRTGVAKNVTRLRERVDLEDLPGAAVSYVAHAGTRVSEVIDDLAERGKKVVERTETAAGTTTATVQSTATEVTTGAKETARKARTTASESKKAAQAQAKKP